MGSMIYQVSDLVGTKRSAFVEEGRHGLARLRDKDGTSLVLIPEERLEHLERVSGYLALLVVVDHIASEQAHPSPSVLGAHAWLRSLPVADFAELSDELGASLIAAGSDGDTEVVDMVVAAWRVTASQMEDPLRRSVLTGNFDANDYTEALRPEVTATALTLDEA